MRRSGCLAAGIFLLVGAVEATAQPVQLGVKGALAFATWPRIQDALVSTGSNYEPDYRIGPVLGGFGTIPLTSWFAVQPELLLVQKGVSLEGPSVNPVWFSAKITYLEVPIVARLGPPTRAETRWYAVAGPAFGVRVHGRVERGTDNTRQPADAKTWLRSGDLGLVAGTGAQWHRWLVEWRITQGLIRANQRLPDLRRDVRNRAVALMVGVTF